MKISFKNKKQIVLLIITAIMIVAIASFGFFFINQETSLDFEVIDSNSKSWVYGCKVHLQDRVSKGFKTLSYTFHRLKPGKWDIRLEAPSYESKTISLDLLPGRNRLAKPIELVGYEIRELVDVSVFETVKDNNLLLDLRLVRKDGEAVENYPCIDIVIIARIQTQLVKGIPGRTTENTPAERGEVLFYGKADWKWNAELNEIYRYSGSIPLSKVQTGISTYWIIDYLFIVPDPRHIVADELDSLVTKTEQQTSIAMLTQFFEGYKGKLTWFYKSNRDVEGK